MRRVVERVAAACAKHGKALGHPAKNADDARKFIELGAKLVVMGSEFAGLKDYFKQCAATLDDAIR
jgi:2-keto-3-deoxy-L-rhamnonate aldolase RhmA